MKRNRPPPTLQDLGEDVMSLVTRVAGRRLWQVLEFVHNDMIKPLEDEVARLKAENAALLTARSQEKQ